MWVGTSDRLTVAGRGLPAVGQAQAVCQCPESWFGLAEGSRGRLVRRGRWDRG